MADASNLKLFNWPNPPSPFWIFHSSPHPIHYLTQMGAKELVINTHHLPETVHRAVENLKLQQNAQWSFEPEILGSGGGIKKVEFWLGDQENFLLANADCVLAAPSGEFLKELVNCHKKIKLSHLAHLPPRRFGNPLWGSLV